MKTWFLIGIGWLFIAFSCQREKEIELTPDSVNQLLGNWKLQQGISPFGTTLTIAVDQPSGGTASGVYSLSFSGKAAVNGYFTTVRLLDWSKGSVVVEDITTTMVGGSSEQMRFEQTYYATLKSVERYALIDKNQLRLHYSGGILVYQKQ